MLSQKLNNLATMLALASTNELRSPFAVLKIAARIAKECSEEATHLQSAQIPNRQRLTEEQIHSGKVVVFPMIPGDGAFT